VSRSSGIYEGERDGIGTERNEPVSVTEKVSYLKEEYFFLQNQYEDFDKRSLSIKGWIAGGALAALGFAPVGKAPGFACIAVASIALSIWILEANWKMFQYGLIDRIRILEAFFRGQPEILFKDPPPFQIYHWWLRCHVEDMPIYADEKRRPQPLWLRFLKIAAEPFVCLPYVVLIALSLIRYFHVSPPS
jgi:hypothetical protein